MNNTKHPRHYLETPFNVSTDLDSLYLILQAFFPNPLYSLFYLKNVLSTYFVSVAALHAGGVKVKSAILVSSKSEISVEDRH